MYNYTPFYPNYTQSTNPYYPQYQQQSMQNMAMVSQQTQVQTPSVQQVPAQPQSQIQNGGFISVRNIEEARNYAVAPGNSITFKDENAPYVYTKTMGFSQLDRPVFEVFKLVKEDDVIQNIPATQQFTQTISLENYLSKKEAETIYADMTANVNSLKQEIERLKQQVSETSKKFVPWKDEKEDEE